MASLDPEPNPVLDETAILTWTITEFAIQVDHVSPLFSAPNSRHKFQFELTGNNSKILPSLAYIGPAEEATIYYRYSIIDANRVKRYTREYFWKYHSSYELDHTIYKSPGKFAKFLVNGSLKFYCEVYIFDVKSATSSKSQIDSFGHLSANYEAFLGSGKLVDFIVLVGAKQFGVHKAILAAQSPVFGAMFEHGETREMEEGQMVIEDVQVEVFELFIRYIYTGKVNELGDYATELLVAADKYQLDHLKSICEQSLISSITTESACGVLLLSDMHNADQLKSKCIEFVVEHAQEVMLTAGWKELAKSKRNDLIAQLFEKLAASINQKHKTV